MIKERHFEERGVAKLTFLAGLARSSIAALAAWRRHLLSSLRLAESLALMAYPLLPCMSPAFSPLGIRIPCVDVFLFCFLFAITRNRGATLSMMNWSPLFLTTSQSGRFKYCTPPTVEKWIEISAFCYISQASSSRSGEETCMPPRPDSFRECNIQLLHPL